MERVSRIGTEELSKRIPSLMENEDPLADAANLVAELHHGRGYFWTGIYRVRGEELILGPFQGPVACVRIPKGKGVCGTAWERGETVVVPDVEEFPGHIACSPESRSEIVLPLRGKDGNVVAVLDIDSDERDFFDEEEKLFLERVIRSLEPFERF